MMFWFKFISLLMVVCGLNSQKSVVLAKEDNSLVHSGSMIIEEPRKKQDDSLMKKILPMLATPFIMQITMLPMILMGMKFMLLSSMFLGKLGVILWIIHIIRNNNDNQGGALYSHNVNVLPNDHIPHQNYGYGDQSNYRRRRRRRGIL